MTTALQRAGLNTTTLAADLRKPDGLAVALIDLKTHLHESGLNAEASAALISRAFGGGRSGAAIMELVQHTDILQKKYAQIGAGVRNFGADWTATTHTIQFQADQLKATFVDVGTKLGLALIPRLQEAINSLRDVYHWFQQNQAAARALGVVVGGVLTVAITAWFVSLGRKLVASTREVAGLVRGIASIPSALERTIAGSGAASTAEGAGGASTVIGRTGMLGGLRSGYGLPGSAVNPLVVAMEGGALGGGIGAAETTAESGAGGGTVAAEEGAAAASAGAIESSVVQQVRGIAGSVLGKLTKGAGIAGVGYLGSQLVGQVVGGHTGHVVSSVGGDAAIGAGLGSLVGPEGTAAGAIVGGLVGLLRSVGKDYASKIADEATKGLGGAMHDQLKDRVHADLRTFNDIQPPHKQASPASQARGRLTAAAGSLSPEDLAKRRRAATDAGQQIARALDQGFARYRFLSLNPMESDFFAHLRGMPVRAQEVAAQTMIAFARKMEQEGRLPKGATTKLIADLEAQYPPLRDFLAQQGSDSVRALALSFRNDQVETEARGLVRRAGDSFLQLGDILRQSGGDTRFQWGLTMQFLAQQTQHGTRQMRQEAATELAAMVGLSKTGAAAFAQWMAVGTSRAAISAATNLSGLTQAFATALGDITGQTSSVAKSFGVRAVNYAVAHPKQIVAAVTTGAEIAGAIFHAGGGYVTAPGRQGRDNRHVVLGDGEAVVNHHQQQPVEAAMSFSKAMGVQPYGSLGELFSGVRTKHYMASGGFVGGGNHLAKLVAAANRVSAANFPYAWGGGHEQPSHFEPFDCSGAVSFVTQQAGYRVPTVTSGQMPSWAFPGGPGEATIFYNPVHTFMRIGGRYWGTSGFARPGGGAGWFDQSPSASYLQGFNTIHLPDLGALSNVATPKIQPGGPLTDIANAALKHTAASANHYLDSLTPTAAPGGGGQALNDAGGRHFRGRVSTFGPPDEAAGSTAYGHSSAEAGIAIDPTPPGGWDSQLARSLAGHVFRVTIGSHSAALPVIDKGPENRTIDVTGTGASLMGIDPHSFPTDSIGTADMIAAAGGFIGGGKGKSTVPSLTPSVRAAMAHVHAHISKKRRKAKPAKGKHQTPIERALAPFHRIPDVNNLPGDVDAIKTTINALTDQAGLLGTIASNPNNAYVLDADIPFLAPTLLPHEDIHAGMTVAAAQRLYESLINGTTTTPLTDLQGQLLDWMGQQPDHELLNADMIAILRSTFGQTGVAFSAGTTVPGAQITNMGAQIGQLGHQVAVERHAIGQINAAIEERKTRRTLVDQLAHQAAHRLSNLNKDLDRLKSRSLRDRLAAAEGSAAVNTRVYDAQTQSGYLSDLIAHERQTKHPDRAAIDGWEQRKRDLAAFIHAQHAPRSKKGTDAARIAIARNTLQNEKKPLGEDLRQLAGQTTRIGTGGMLGKIDSQVKTLRTGRGVMQGDIQSILGSTLPSAKLGLIALQQSLPESERPVLPPADGTSADNSQLTDLLRQQNQQLAQAFAVSQSQFATFKNFLPMLPKYEHGGLVHNTGLALVHEGEWITPNPRGPYGSQIPSSSTSHHTNVHLHLEGNAGELMKLVDARVDSRAPHTVSVVQGQRARALGNAPGGKSVRPY